MGGSGSGWSLFGRCLAGSLQDAKKMDEQNPPPSQKAEQPVSARNLDWAKRSRCLEALFGPHVALPSILEFGAG